MTNSNDPVRPKRGWRGFGRKASPETGAINEQYVATAPSRQNIADVFKGQWISGFPDASCVSGGVIPLFHDARIAWLIERCGGTLAGRRVAELGPFEGGHSYMLLQAGAETVQAIEANTINFTKTLFVKEIFGLARLDLQLGEIEAWLAASGERFDLIVASGVLYHFNDPLLALHNIARRTDRIFLWTHFLHDAYMPAGDLRLSAFSGRTSQRSVGGFTCTYHPRSYDGAQAKAAFCGGILGQSIWMTHGAIVGTLAHWGFAVEETMLEPNHANGPCACFLATRLATEPAAAPDEPPPGAAAS